MKNEKSQQGITLIALVVTIVVLLILAGITIAFVLSDGGIFQSAQDAKIEQMRATIEDYAIQIQPTVTARYYANGAEGEILLASNYELQSKESKEKLKSDLGKEIAEVMDTTKFFPGCAVEIWGYGVASENGNIVQEQFLVTSENGEEFTITFDQYGQVKVEVGDMRPS